MKGIIVVGRSNPHDKILFPTAPITKCALSLSIHEVLNLYRGIEGELWPWAQKDDLRKRFEDVCTLEVKELAHIRHYLDNLTFKGKVDMIYVAVNEDVCNENENSLMPMLGYDYGYIDEFGVYSVIFHEILYGRIREMREYVKILNTNMLFNSLSDIAVLEETRNQLLSRGAALETSPTPLEMMKISVYEINRYPAQYVDIL
ncbi:MAG: hypothetical protein OEZ55_04685 [Nitrospinota bacterium]|nr:hypothetical protein [Nitrospinota bacterium]